jgi:ribosomal protein S6
MAAYMVKKQRKGWLKWLDFLQKQTAESEGERVLSVRNWIMRCICWYKTTHGLGKSADFARDSDVSS